MQYLQQAKPHTSATADATRAPHCNHDAISATSQASHICGEQVSIRTSSSQHLRCPGLCLQASHRKSRRWVDGCAFILHHFVHVCVYVYVFWCTSSQSLQRQAVSRWLCICSVTSCMYVCMYLDVLQASRRKSRRWVDGCAFALSLLVCMCVSTWCPTSQSPQKQTVSRWLCIYPPSLRVCMCVCILMYFKPVAAKAEGYAFVLRHYLYACVDETWHAHLYIYTHTHTHSLTHTHKYGAKAIVCI
jgi:hypothetical protein